MLTNPTLNYFSNFHLETKINRIAAYVVLTDLGTMFF